jgi:hypothetical protein
MTFDVHDMVNSTMSKKWGKKPRKGRTERLSLRVDEPNAEHIEVQSKNPHFGNKTNYLNWLIAQDRAGRDEGLRGLEETLVKTINTLEKEIRNIRINAATLNAFTHAFVKMYLVNHPEADPDTKRLAQSTAKARYQRLLEQAAQELSYGEDEDADEEEE